MVLSSDICTLWPVIIIMFPILSVRVKDLIYPRRSTIILFLVIPRRAIIFIMMLSLKRDATISE
jgi:hypothetical protein